MAKQLPRGIRNKNPLNIRKGENWMGLVAVSTDKAFCQFISMRWGLRAAVIILKKYITKYKCDTIRKIITRWAPPSENNTVAYVDMVCQRTGYKPDEKFKFTDKTRLCAIIQAMSFVENGGQYITFNDVLDGYALATTTNPY